MHLHCKPGPKYTVIVISLKSLESYRLVECEELQGSNVSTFGDDFTVVPSEIKDPRNISAIQYTDIKWSRSNSQVHPSIQLKCELSFTPTLHQSMVTLEATSM